MNSPKHYRVFPNVGIADGESGCVEFDALIVGDWAVYLVDIKRLSGRVMIDPNVWTLEDSRSILSPVAGIVNRTKWFAGWLGARQQSSSDCPWCQPFVVVTGAGTNSPNLFGKGDSLVLAEDQLIDALISCERLTTARPRKVSDEQREAVVDAIMDQGNPESENWEQQWQS